MDRELLSPLEVLLNTKGEVVVSRRPSALRALCAPAFLATFAAWETTSAWVSRKRKFSGPESGYGLHWRRLCSYMSEGYRSRGALTC